MQPILLYLVFGWDLITCVLLLTLTLGLARWLIVLPKKANNVLSIIFCGFGGLGLRVWGFEVWGVGGLGVWEPANPPK